MRVELDVDLRPAIPELKPEPVSVPSSPEEKLRRYREERFLRRVALAQVIEDAISVGDFQDLADAAHRCRVSRARVSAVVSCAR